MPTNENLPQGKKERKKEKIIFNLFDFTKMQKNSKILFFKMALRKLHTFPNFPRGISQNCQKPKKKFTDSALIIQERDFSHL